jgi:radical SAM-linked protein
LVVAREGGLAGTQREVAAEWTAAVEAAGLPLVGGEVGRGRARIAFGAPLPVGMAGEHELIDIVLTEAWPIWRLREALVPHVPTGWTLNDVHDVWLGGPPLAGRVAAADYRIELEGDPDAAAVQAAAEDLVAAGRISRQRVKGGTTVDYDLRPLLVSLAVDPGPPVIVRTRTRFDPELGTGRPEEVLAALGERLSSRLEARSIVRERLLLADEDVP